MTRNRLVPLREFFKAHLTVSNLQISVYHLLPWCSRPFSIWGTWEWYCFLL